MLLGKQMNIRALLTATIIIITTSVSGSLLDEANAAYAKNNMRDAITLYTKAALAGENPTLCYFNCANAWYQIDSLARSIVYYQACIASAPEFFRARLNLAIVYYALDDLGGTIAAALVALGLEPGNTKAQLLLAASYRRVGALPEAAVAFERLAETDPSLEDPPLALAEIYRDLEDPASEEKWLLRCPEGGKNQAYINLMLADLNQKQGAFSKAQYYVKRAIEADPSNRWAYYQNVVLLEKQGNEQVARIEALESLELFPAFSELALLAGTLSFKTGRIEEAERLYGMAYKNGSAEGLAGLENVRLERKRNAERNEALQLPKGRE